MPTSWGRVALLGWEFRASGLGFEISGFSCRFPGIEIQGSKRTTWPEVAAGITRMWM